MISEGSADSYAHILYPDVQMPWHTLNLPEGGLERVSDNLSSTDRTTISMLMWNQWGRDYIDWSGNSIGFQILQSFLRNNPNLSVAEWTAMTSEEILEKSEFEWGLGQPLAQGPPLQSIPAWSGRAGVL